MQAGASSSRKKSSRKKSSRKNTIRIAVPSPRRSPRPAPRRQIMTAATATATRTDTAIASPSSTEPVTATVMAAATAQATPAVPDVCRRRERDSSASSLSVGNLCRPSKVWITMYPLPYHNVIALTLCTDLYRITKRCRQSNAYRVRCGASRVRAPGVWIPSERGIGYGVGRKGDGRMESERQGNDEPLVAHPTMAFVLDGILILAVAVVGLWMFGSLLWAVLGGIFCAATHLVCRATGHCGAPSAAVAQAESQQSIPVTSAEVAQAA